MDKRFLVVDNVEKGDRVYNDLLVKMVTEVSGVEPDRIQYTDIDKESSQDLRRRCGGIIISGASPDYPESALWTRLQHMNWVRTVGLPILGVCMGGQNLSLLFGGRTVEDATAEEGLVALRGVKSEHVSGLMKGIHSGDNVWSSHTAATIPDDHEFTILASSADCANMAMAHNKLPIFGVQFHPELRPDLTDTGRIVVGNFIDMAVKLQPSPPESPACVEVEQLAA